MTLCIHLTFIFESHISCLTHNQDDCIRNYFIITVIIVYILSFFSIFVFKTTDGNGECHFTCKISSVGCRFIFSSSYLKKNDFNGHIFAHNYREQSWKWRYDSGKGCMFYIDLIQRQQCIFIKNFIGTCFVLFNCSCVVVTNASISKLKIMRMEMHML